jgi:putative chitinase
MRTNWSSHYATRALVQQALQDAGIHAGGVGMATNPMVQAAAIQGMYLADQFALGGMNTNAAALAGLGSGIMNPMGAPRLTRGIGGMGGLGGGMTPFGMGFPNPQQLASQMIQMAMASMGLNPMGLMNALGQQQMANIMGQSGHPLFGQGMGQMDPEDAMSLLEAQMNRSNRRSRRSGGGGGGGCSGGGGGGGGGGPSINSAPSGGAAPSQAGRKSSPAGSSGNSGNVQMNNVSPGQSYSGKGAVTADQLQAIAKKSGHRLSSKRANEVAPHINRAMAEAGINSPKQKAAFVAQLMHESGGFRYNEEIASGAAYEGRRDLGNTQPGDGRRFKGRGFIQLTGRHNYTKAGQALGLDLVNNPQLAAKDENAARVAAWYWKSRGLNKLAEQGNYDAITKRINGGYNGKRDRDRLYANALRVLQHSYGAPVPDVAAA